MNTNNWISVKDRLPENHKTRVLCFVVKKFGEKETIIEVGHMMLNSEAWIIGNHFSWDIGTVTHWMPLPESPNLNQ